VTTGRAGLADVAGGAGGGHADAAGLVFRVGESACQRRLNFDPADSSGVRKELGEPF
jgi:hypothetical protein